MPEPDTGRMAHTRQSRPDSGFGFQVKVLKTLEVVFFIRNSKPTALTSQTHRLALLEAADSRGLGRVQHDLVFLRGLSSGRQPLLGLRATKNGSSQGQILAVTALFMPSLLDRGSKHLDVWGHLRRGAVTNSAPPPETPKLRILVYLVIYDCG